MNTKVKLLTKAGVSHQSVTSEIAKREYTAIPAQILKNIGACPSFSLVLIL